MVYIFKVSSTNGPVWLGNNLAIAVLSVKRSLPLQGCVGFSEAKTNLTGPSKICMI